MAEVVTGSCMCGSVRFEITLPTKWCAHCRCVDCRRAHAGEIHVALGCLDGAIDRAPQANTYRDRHPAWAEGVESLPKLGGDNGNTPF